MTTMESRPGLNEIFNRLDSLQSRRRLMRLAMGVVAVLTVVMGSLLVALPAAGYWPDQPPAALRWSILALLCVLWAAAVAWYLVRTAAWRQNPAQTARFAEQALPELRNDLINSVLLAKDRGQVSPELVAEAIREAARRSRRVDVYKSISPVPLQRWGIAAGVAALCLAALSALQGPVMKRGLMAILTPTRYVPVIGTVRILSVEPGDAACFPGESITVTAMVDNPDQRDLTAEVLVEGEDVPRPMIPDVSQRNFTCALGQLQQDLNYAVRIGGTRWPLDRPYYEVAVQSVRVKGLDLHYNYPKYTRLEARTAENADGNIEAPMGTEVGLKLRLSAPLSAVVLERKDGASEPLKPSADGQTHTGSIVVEQDGAYRLISRDSRGRTQQLLPDLATASKAPSAYSAAGQVLMSGYYRVTALPDAPPRVEFLAPNRDLTLPPGAKLPLKVRASDKYGLTDVYLTADVESPARKVADEHFAPKDQPEATFDYELAIPADFKDDGSVVIVYYATATDNRNLPRLGGPQTAVSSKFKITVQNAARLAEEKARRYDELRKRLMDILKLQEVQRVNTEVCRKSYADALAFRSAGQDAKARQDKARSGAGEIETGQRKIKAELLDLADKFPFDPEMITIQQAVAVLANNEAQLAIDQTGIVQQVVAAMDTNVGAIDALAKTQDKIIDTLRTLLAIMPSLANKAEDKQESRAGGDLPPEAREKLQDLKRGLEEFIEEQRKAIQTGDRLAKKPVDDFTAADDKALKDLQATQDKWEKFLNEAFTDFSKMAQQDFSNPSTMKELVSVKSDITMAKDALSKKAVEMATALEDNGIENATSLTANIEKWLPDKPDREAWKMEEPVGQENVEAPELPKELEDLVGDLLEEEEDLFEEMDDVAAKYTASGDKGIGWDALDGPISSMNAQGVTGNQLPNTNELAGRSGEGRQGKSTGEFVEDKFVGKGGRQTPTRLTPEPFQKGHVKDTSSEPPGGATGGGKMSGSGEEGLEGPVPPEMKEDLKRLSGKQASLVNKSERLRERFEANNFAGFKMLQSIILMNRVRQDLDTYRYQNALRAKDVTLDSLRQVRIYTSGEMNVDADTTAHMPKYVRDDIADAMKGKKPEEYREVLEEYYRRLSEQASR